MGAHEAVRRRVAGAGAACVAFNMCPPTGGRKDVGIGRIGSPDPRPQRVAENVFTRITGPLLVRSPNRWAASVGVRYCTDMTSRTLSWRR